MTPQEERETPEWKTHPLGQCDPKTCWMCAVDFKHFGYYPIHNPNGRPYTFKRAPTVPEVPKVSETIKGFNVVEWPNKMDTNSEPKRPQGILTEGVKFDTDKPRTDLLPTDALLEVAAVLSYGAKKYAARNWEKGMTWGRLSSAALRHLFLWMGGEDSDKESGHRHLAHFACCALMLLSLTLRKVGTDDRT